MGNAPAIWLPRLTRPMICWRRRRSTTQKVDKLLDTANKLAADPRIQGGLTQTVGNINAASANGLKLTNQLNGLLISDNAQVQALLKQTQAGAQVSLNNIAATTASIRDTTQREPGPDRGHHP